MPVCYLAAGYPGRLAARNCRAAMARLTRPGKDAGSPGALPQPRGSGIYRFLRCGDGRQTASAAGTVPVVHRVPRGRQIPGTAGVWSSTTTTSLTDVTHRCGTKHGEQRPPRRYIRCWAAPWPLWPAPAHRYRGAVRETVMTQPARGEKCPQAGRGHGHVP
jgi:hypothetical protein